LLLEGKAIKHGAVGQEIVLPKDRRNPKAGLK
jgi:hypothetical protein